jgi:type II secretory pathway component PulF
VTLRHRIRFYQQLAVLTRAGLPIRASLARLNERLKEDDVELLSTKVNEGERLGDAFVAAGFTPFECNLVVAGERSAHLDEVFEHLGEFWERRLEMQQAVIRPLYYPVAVLHLSLLAGLLVETYMMSWPAALMHFIERLAMLYGGVALLFFAVRASWKNESMRRILLRVPIVGNSLVTGYAYRWITALRIEFIAGIALATAVGDAWRASGFMGGDELAIEGEQSMREGTSLSILVQRWKQLPSDWIDFIETGEVSGALEKALINLESEAARSWRLAQERMADWLPKILYLAVLLVVAGVVLNLMNTTYLNPITNMENQIDNFQR